MTSYLVHVVAQTEDDGMQSSLFYSVRDDVWGLTLEVAYPARVVRAQLPSEGQLILRQDGTTNELIAASGTIEIGEERDGALVVDLCDLRLRHRTPETPSEGSTADARVGQISGDLRHICTVLVAPPANVPVSPLGPQRQTQADDAWSSDFCRNAATQLGLDPATLTPPG